MIGFGNISMLWGLFGLLLPIAIHFLSNKESQEVLFGSTMFLRDEETSNPKSFILSDLWLLLIRCALIATIVLLMAKPYWHSLKSNGQVWIEKEVYQDQKYQDLLQEYSAYEKQIIFDINGIDTSVIQYSSLWTVFAAANNEDDSIKIITFNKAKYYLGSEVTLSGRVQVVPIPHLTEAENILIGNNSFRVQQNNQILSFERDPNHSDQELMLKTKLVDPENKLSELTNLIGQIAKEIGIGIEYTDEGYDYLIGNSDVKVSDDITAILWKPTDQPLRIRNSRYNILHIEGAIDQNEIVTSDIAVQIGFHLMKPNLRLDSIDHRTNPLDLHKSNNSKAPFKKEPLSAIWWLLILPLFLAERHLSSNSKSS